MTKIDVIKQDHYGNEVWRYQGEVIRRTEDSVLISAVFNRDYVNASGLELRRGDLFIERYFTQRWYNLFKVIDPLTSKTKGWYCNVCTPAVVDDRSVAYRDLALDVVVIGQNIVVADRDEFEALDLDNETRGQSLRAMDDLLRLAELDGLDGLLQDNLGLVSPIISNK